MHPPAALVLDRKKLAAFSALGRAVPAAQSNQLEKQASQLRMPMLRMPIAYESMMYLLRNHIGVVCNRLAAGGNITGLSLQSTDLAGKRLEFLREIIPGLRRVAVMAYVGYAASVLEMNQVEATARKLGLEVEKPRKAGWGSEKVGRIFGPWWPSRIPSSSGCAGQNRSASKSSSPSQRCPRLRRWRRSRSSGWAVTARDEHARS